MLGICIAHQGRPWQDWVLGHGLGVSLTDEASIKHVLSDNFENYVKVRGDA